MLTINYIYADGVNLTVTELSPTIMETNTNYLFPIKVIGRVSSGAKYGVQLSISGDAVDRGFVSINGSDMYIYDYTSTTGEKNIYTIFYLTIKGDRVLHDNRDFTVNIFTPSGSDYQFTGIANDTQTVTIVDDDKVEVNVLNQNWQETGVDVVRTQQFSTTNGNTLPSDVNIQYEVLDSSTATFGVDYTGIERQGVIVLQAHQSTINIPDITIISDSISEDMEYIDILYSDPSNRIVFSTDESRIYISELRNPTVKYYGLTNSKTINEGSKIKVWFELTNAISSASSSIDVQINHGPSDSNKTTQATSDSDISLSQKSFTLTFPASKVYQSLLIQTFDDKIREPLEAFHVVITNSSSNIDIDTSNDRLDINIKDNDFKVEAKITTDFKSIKEGESACINVSVDKSKDHNYNLLYQINFNEAIAKSNANIHDFIDGTDLSGNLIIHAGTNSSQICFATKNDNLIEEDELFEFSIHTPADDANIVIPTNFKSSVKVRINNDDNLSNGGKIDIGGTGIAAPTIINSINYPITFYESDINKMEPFHFYLDKPAPFTGYNLQYSLISDYAKAGEDFTAKSSVVNFDLNDTNATVYLEIIGDNEAEYLENFILSISSNNLSIENEDINISILDDEISVSIEQTTFTVNEGDCNFSVNCDSNPTNIVSLPSIKLSSLPIERMTVDYELVERTAKKNIDFKPLQGQLVFDTSSPTKVNLNMEIYTNLLENKDKRLTLKLSNPQGLDILQGELNILIKDDDIKPNIKTFIEQVSESDENQTKNLVIQLTRTPKLDYNISYSFIDGTAIKGEDYDAEDGVFQISRLNTSGNYYFKQINIIGDFKEEKPKKEEFYMKIARNDYANFQKDSDGNDKDTITITIRDDDTIPLITDTEKSIDETDYNRTEILQINMDNINKYDRFTVRYKIEGGNAIENSDYIKDYNGSYGIAYIEKNQKFFNIPVKIIADRIDEPTKFFNLTIYNINTTKLKILDDENATSLTMRIYINDESDPLPFTCNSNLYLSSTFDYETSTNFANKMYLYDINITNQIFTFNKKNPQNGSDFTYNALGYNPDDNYMYAMYLNYLYRIGTDKIKKVGLIENLNSEQYYAGVFNKSGLMYIGGLSIDTDEVYALNITTGKIIKTIKLSKSLSMFDYGIRDDKELYVIPPQSFLHKINLENGQVTVLKANYVANDVKKYNFDAFYSDREDKMYANDSNGNGFYQILKDGTFSFISNSEKSSNNDGANCPTEVINIFKDRSDAPSSYGEVYHIIDAKLKIGKSVDHEYSLTTSTLADGDDLSGTDDEDGVINDITLKFPKDKFELEVEVTNLKDNIAYLKGWIDFNKDGIFNPSESVLTTINKETNSSKVKLTWNFTETTLVLIEVDTFLRLRLTSDLNSLDTDNSKDGEVEDHKIKIINEVFYNVERIDSKSSLDTKSRQSLYTQITDKEFDYSLVFYKKDFATEREIDINSVAKIEIIDNIDSGRVIAVDYVYITQGNKRFNSTITSSYATKNAKFKITLFKNKFNGISTINCEQYGSNIKACYDKLASTNNLDGGIIDGGIIDDSNGSDVNDYVTSTVKEEFSKDNFAIRPQSFIIDLTANIADKDIVETAEEEIDFNAEAVSIISNTKSIITSFTNTDSKILLKFKGNSSCSDKTDQLNKDITFTNGKAEIEDFYSTNVGLYELSILNKKWTIIDQNSTNLGCILNSSSNTITGGKYGCDISAYEDIPFNFEPHRLDINITNIKNNLYTSLNSIYMDNIIDFSSSGLLIEGNIQATGAKGGRLTNFTNGCASNEIRLNLDTNMSLSGTLTSPQTIYGTSLNPKIFISTDSNNSILLNLDNNLSILKNDFLYHKRGIANFKMLINLERNMLEESNPVVINFNKLSAELNVSEHSTHIPRGLVNINEKASFLYSKIMSNKDKYEPVLFNPSSSGEKKTLISLVSIAFCNDISFCNDKTDLNITKHLASGGNWYRIFNFTNSRSSLKVELGSSNLSIDSIYPEFNQGISNFDIKYSGTSEIKQLINLNLPSWFSHENHAFEVSFIPQEDNNFKGLGELGSILKDHNLNRAPNKMN